MSNDQQEAGSVVALFRYPVKSMMGEELNAADVTASGLLGDRAYALVDSSTGKVASAKNPRKWPDLFNYRATYTEPPQPGAGIPPVRITLPDGTTISNVHPDCAHALSKALRRTVMLHTTGLSHEQARLQAEEYTPDMDHYDHPDTVTDFTLPEGMFFDSSVVHLLTTATLNQLRECYPAGRFEARRFRPNIVIQPSTLQKGFIENEWIGRTLVIGEKVRLTITGASVRCVMTTLPQGDLPADPGILQAAVKNNKATVGVYAKVIQGGRIRRGNIIRLE